MPRWQPLNPVNDRPFFGKALKSRAAASKVEVEAINQAREQHDATAQRAREETCDPSTFNVEELAGPSHRTARLTLLQRELRCRGELSQVEELAHAAIRAEADKANQRHLDCRDAVRDKLLAIGFRPENTHEPDPCALQPLMFDRHPSVYEAMQERDALRYEASVRAFKVANDEAIAAIERELIEVRKRNMAVA